MSRWMQEGHTHCPVALPLDTQTLYCPSLVSRVNSWIQLRADTSSDVLQDSEGGATTRGDSRRDREAMEARSLAFFSHFQ